MATRLDAITTAYLLATGKSSLPSAGSTKRNLLTNLAIKYYRDWQTEPGMEWASLYSDVSAGTAQAGNGTYDLDETINFISQADGNYIRIATTGGQYTIFKTVRPQQLFQYRYQNAAAKIADNQIQFSRLFSSDEQVVGGAISVPAILKLDDLTSDASEVLIDNPEWLGVRVAAQYAYSFKSTRNMYPDLLDQANELMTGMKLANEPVSASYNSGIDYFATQGNVWSDCL